MPANNLLLTEFYEYDLDGLEVEVAVDSFSMIIVGREDSILYNNSKEVKSFTIPLSDSLDFLKVVLKINDGVDTMYLNYLPYSVFRSTECGVINRYEIVDDSTTENKITKRSNVNKIIDETEAVNLKMFVDLN